MGAGHFGSSLLHKFQRSMKMNLSLKRKQIVAFAALALLLITAFLALRKCGDYLVVDNARKSDVILIPARGLPRRYDRGFDLLRNGYAPHLIADVPAINYFGNPAPEMAEKYFAQQQVLASKIDICVVKITLPESIQAGKCLEKFQPKSVLIVAGEFQTRRALIDFSRNLPQYQWSVTPSQPHPQFPVPWWTNQHLARIVYTEWNQLLWSEIFDR